MKLLLALSLVAFAVAANFPDAFDWRSVNGQSFMTPVLNDQVPIYCADPSTAFAHASYLSDRIKIGRKALGADIILAPQGLLNCVGESTGSNDTASCGLDASQIRKHLAKNGIADVSCCPYEGKRKQCTAMNTCFTESPKDKKDPHPILVSNPMLWGIGESGTIPAKDTDAMMKEIQANGPIHCAMTIPASFKSYNGGVFKDCSGSTKHSVSVAGWGTDLVDGPYWVVRNSWGYQFGEEGFARVARGSNCMNIESSCDWALPKQISGPSPRVHSAIVSAPPGLPTDFDWGNVNGKSYLTPIINQFVPHFCNSACAAHAHAAYISDRIKIQRKTADNGTDFMLSVQAMINCAKPGTGACETGGSKTAQFLKKHPIPDRTCAPYMAEQETCTEANTCFTANADGTKTPVHKPDVWGVSATGKIPTGNVAAMQQEIMKNGPIHCSTTVPETLSAYTGGIFKDCQTFQHGHAVSLVGWGTDPKDGDYWIMRNSWGNHWGEGGFVRLQRGVDCMNIESKGCDWALPKRFSPGPGPAPGPSPPAPGPSPPTPGGCTAALDHYCKSVKMDRTQCKACFDNNKAALKAAGCADHDGKKYCGAIAEAIV